MKVRIRKSNYHFDFNTLTVKKITINFTKRINLRAIRKRNKPIISMKLRSQMVEERLNNLYLKKDRVIDSDFIHNRIKRFLTYYCSDTWIRTETKILDKLNLKSFSLRQPREIPFSKFKKIQERINHYKIRIRNTNDFETAFKSFKIKFNKYRIKPKSEFLEYRLGDLTKDWNLRLRNYYDIPYILSKKCSMGKYKLNEKYEISNEN